MSVAKFVRTGVAVIAVLIMAKTAQAADLYGGGYKDQYNGGYRDRYGGGYKDEAYYVPAPIWTGFYIGGNIGGSWASIEAASNLVFLGANPGSILVDRSIDSSGIFGGIQGGYNFQSGNFLYGIEADLGGFDVSGTRTFFDPATPLRSLQVSGNGGWYGDITARGGFLVNGNALIYGKAGFAFFSGNVTVTDSFDNIHQDGGTFTGWTAGAGVEYMFNPRWTMKIEYLYFDFGDNNFNFSNSTNLDNSLTVNTVKIGFNYLLNWRGGPLY
jgi:opacity protein-like surface antigen